MVTNSELHPVLEQSLSQHFRTACRILRLERCPAANRSSFALEEMTVYLDDDMVLPLMFKDLSWQAMHERVHHAKPGFLYNPLREIKTYQSILPSRQLDTATCYGAVADAQLARYWLFLEKVLGKELYLVGEFETWKQVARWLVRMHSPNAGSQMLFREAETAHLLWYDQTLYAQWARRARTFLEHSDATYTRCSQRELEGLFDCYHRAIEWLLSLPMTLIHGEFYASNVLVQESNNGLRVCPVDWEMAAVGPGLIDLAALTAGSWTEDERTEMALAYYVELLAQDDWSPTVDLFMVAFNCCQLHLAIQWLGWSQTWSPPPEQAQDWLGEALRLVETLRGIL